MLARKTQLLFEIAGSVRTPTKNKTFGHYVCVLVEVDLPKHLHEEVMVDINNFAFFVGIIYEMLPFSVISAIQLVIPSQLAGIKQNWIYRERHDLQ